MTVLTTFENRCISKSKNGTRVHYYFRYSYVNIVHRFTCMYVYTYIVFHLRYLYSNICTYIRNVPEIGFYSYKNNRFSINNK